MRMNHLGFDGDDNNDENSSIDVSGSFGRILLKSPSSTGKSSSNDNDTDMVMNERLNLQESINGSISVEAHIQSRRQLQLETPTQEARNDSASQSTSDIDPADRNLHESESSEEETEEVRRLREEAESLALARQFMAEEAMFSYNESANFLQENANEYSEEDLAALRAIMAEENPVIEGELEDDAEEGMDSADMSYEALLNLGERIGDVKSERWAMRAKHEIAKLPVTKFCMSMAEGKDENDSGVKCLVCQSAYKEGETIRHLPCKHYFHHECVDRWLMAKDCCPYCRQCILVENAKR